MIISIIKCNFTGKKKSLENNNRIGKKIIYKEKTAGMINTKLAKFLPMASLFNLTFPYL